MSLNMLPDDIPRLADALLFESKYILHRDHIPLHPDDLGETGQAASPVGEPGQLNHHVDGAGDLLADGPLRQIQIRHGHHGLQAIQGIPGGIRVERRKGTVVPRVHRLEHVDGFGAPHLTHHDPVRTHSQRVDDQGPLGHCTLALQVRGAGLQTDNPRLSELELGGVLHRDDSLRRRNEG
jgi:hypothetical protein